jgi:hypothetical protein
VALIDRARRALVPQAPNRGCIAPIRAHGVVQNYSLERHGRALGIGKGRSIVPSDAIDFDSRSIAHANEIVVIQTESLVHDGCVGFSLIRVRGRVIAIGVVVTIVAENNVGTRSDQKFGCNGKVLDSAIGHLAGKGPARQVNCNVVIVVQFKPLALVIGNRARLAHNFIDKHIACGYHCRHDRRRGLKGDIIAKGVLHGSIVDNGRKRNVIDSHVKGNFQNSTAARQGQGNQMTSFIERKWSGWRPIV